FSGTDLMDVLQKVVSAEAPPVEHFAPHVPSIVGAVLRRGLSKEPEARYANVLEFAVAFSSACECSVPPPQTEVLGIARTVPAPVSAPIPSGNRFVGEQAVERRLETGPQQRAANRLGHASTLSGAASLQDIPDALERARQALGLGDLNLAVSYAESALRVAEGFDNIEARRLLDAEEMLIDHIFETRIGSLNQRLTVVGVPSSADARVSPEQAFLLSRLDGGVTVEEVLDLSPLARRDTLRCLLAMLRDGLIAIGELRPSEKLKLEH
ncbi:MAG TPA: hypothetical protein VHW01_01200, partial [Polyangiaceae bacterium]|nr:hypothetical protein [Polyangiaceae bacterium]